MLLGVNLRGGARPLSPVPALVVSCARRRPSLAHRPLPSAVRPCGLWRPPLLLAQWLRAWLLPDRQATVSAAGAAQLKVFPVSLGSVVALVGAVWLGKFLRFSAWHLDRPAAIDWLLRTREPVRLPAPLAALRVVAARYFVLRRPAYCWHLLSAVVAATIVHARSSRQVWPGLTRARCHRVHHWPHRRSHVRQCGHSGINGLSICCRASGRNDGDVGDIVRHIISDVIAVRDVV